MITKTKTGVKVSGTLAKDVECKIFGGNPVHIFNLKAFSEKKDGRWESYFVDVKVWGEHPEMDEMYLKGDYIEAVGREIEDKAGSNGKIYHNLTADDVAPGGLVILRWMQQAIDAVLSASPQELPMMTETDEKTPFDVPAAQPVQASMDEYAARARDEEMERQLDATEEDDLPF